MSGTQDGRRFFLVLRGISALRPASALRVVGLTLQQKVKAWDGVCVVVGKRRVSVGCVRTSSKGA